jgi:hypothetical protein
VPQRCTRPGVNAPVICWGARVAWADEKPKAADSKPTEYVSATFELGGKNIRIWRFDPKAPAEQPGVLLLHVADGGVGVEGM